MNIQTVYTKYLKFASNRTMSRRALKTFSLKYNRPFKIWGTTKDGERYSGREMFSFNGPSTAPGSPFANYNYPALGYMIFFDMNKGGYRTFIYDNIESFEQDGVKYDIV